MLRDGLAKFRCVADLDTDKPKAVNIEEASKNSIVPRISGMQRLFRIVYLPLSGGVCPSPKRMSRFAGLLGVLLMAKWNWGSLSTTRVGNVCGRLNDGAQGLHGPRGI